MVGWGVQKPGIGTVLHWRSPDVHIFDTDPSLVYTKLELMFAQLKLYPFCEYSLRLFPFVRRAKNFNLIISIIEFN